MQLDQQETSATATLRRRRHQMQLACAWAGVAGVVLLAIAFIPTADFIPPPSPSDSAQEIADRYAENADGIRWGMLLGAVGFSLVVAWGIALAARTWEQFPVLAMIQVSLIGVSMFVGVLFCVIAQVAAFRAGEIDPAITQALNDSLWFIVLIWAPFDLWLVALGLSILFDTRPAPALPRWCGYLTLMTAGGSMPAGMIPFFKDGPFAYDGAIAFFLPVGIFFVWVVPLTWALITTTKAEMAADDPAPVAA
jgi:hypothetical protein